MRRTAIALSLSVVLANLPVSAQNSGSERTIPASLHYERSGATREAALYAEALAPALGEAHALNLARELTSKQTSQELATLAKYGPWLTSDGISVNAQQLIRAIQNAHIHGLNPQAYGQAEVLRTLDTLSYLDTTRTITNDPLSAFDPRFDLLREKFSQLLDLAFERLILHHGQGLVDARSLQTGLFRDVPVIKIDTLKQALTSGRQSAADALLSVQHRHSDYRKLTQRMRNLLTEYATGIERTTVAITGDSYTTHSNDNVSSIKRRLVETGDLPTTITLTPLIDAELVVAVKRFQKRNGLTTSGIVDIMTQQALNTSIEDEITAIALSLERWRWMPRELGDKHLFVNIPDYRVVIKEDDQITLSMITVVGSTQHQTPAFSREMSYMEFNPTWTVPSSIANKELVPKERRRPGYLASRQFDYFQRINNRLIRVPAENITTEDFNKHPFPYVLQQRGGPINALGRMKFMMPNPYAIYLHDTQIKNHFTLNDRAFSHGCIRLSEPAKLAKHLLEGDGYTEREISNALESDSTKRIRFRTPILTHLTYLTTWIDEDGALQQRPDIYGHDPALTTALRAGNSLLSVISPATSLVSADAIASNEQDL